jgi:hypothetical protein
LEHRLELADGTREASLVVVLYHPFDLVADGKNPDAPFGIARLESLLQKVKNCKGAAVKTLSQLGSSDSTLTTQRYLASCRLESMRRFWRRILPTTWLPGEGRMDLYLQNGDYAALLWLWYVLTAGLLAAAGVAGEAGRRVALALVTQKRRLIVSVAGGLLFLFGVAACCRLMQRGWPLNGIRVLPTVFFAPWAVWLGYRLSVRLVSQRFGAGRNRCKVEEFVQAAPDGGGPWPGGGGGDRRPSPGARG